MYHNSKGKKKVKNTMTGEVDARIFYLSSTGVEIKAISANCSLAVLYFDNNLDILPGFDYRLDSRVGDDFAENPDVALDGVQVDWSCGNRRLFLPAFWRW